MRCLILLLLLTACGSSDEPLTRGEVCVEEARIFCAKRVSCGDSINVDYCKQSFTASCCSALCGSETEYTASDVDTCESDLAGWACTSTITPESCPTFDE